MTLMWMALTWIALTALVAAAETGSPSTQTGRRSIEADVKATVEATADATAETTVKSAFDEQSVRLLEERMGYWYQRGRPDRLNEVVEQMLRVYPQHPLLLEMDATLAFQQGDRARALRIFTRLRQSAPDHPATVRLRETIALPEAAQTRLSDARMLALAGRYSEASAAIQAAFATPPLSPDLAIEYWHIRSRAGEAATALRGLQTLQGRYPNHGGLQLAIIRLRLLQDALRDTDIRQLTRLTADAVVGGEALALWERVAFTLQASARHLALLEAVLAMHPGQAAIREVYDRLSAEHRKQLALERDPHYQYQQRGLSLLDAGDPAAAEAWLRKALPQRHHDPRLLGGLGYATLRQGKHGEAVDWFRRAARAEPVNSLWPTMQRIATFWHGLGQVDDAIEQQQLSAASTTLKALMRNPEAKNHQPRLLLRAARIAMANNDMAGARDLYHQVLEADPATGEAAWALFASYRDAGDFDALDRFYQQLPEALQASMAAEYRRIRAKHLIGRADAAEQEQLSGGVYDEVYGLLEQALSLTPDDPWLVARLARLDEANGQPERARHRFEDLLQRAQLQDSQLQDYQLQDSQLPDSRLPDKQQSADTYFAYGLYLARHEQDEAVLDAIGQVPAEQRSDGMNALVERANSRLRARLRDQETVLTFGLVRDDKSGVPGISELRADTLLLDLRVPFTGRKGYWQLRIDPTWLDAGAMNRDDTYWRHRLGTGLRCENAGDDADGSERDCPAGIQKPAREFGVALGAGADFERWWFDIGHSPVGFNRSTWVGGVGMRGSLGDFGLRLSLERRIVASTLISFAGMQDPFSNRNWGAVTRNGLGLGTSWDQGGRFGWWGNLGVEAYRGAQVAANQRWYAYTGGYLRAYGSEPLAVTVGLTALAWGFDKDLSHDTVGHGAYYSPQIYRSLSLPVTVFGRVDRWSYLLRGSIGYSSTRTAAEDFFPDEAGLQQQALDNVSQGKSSIDPVFTGGTGGGRSHGLTSVFEYHLSRHWTIGFKTDIVRSDTFAPNQGMVYLRYHFGGFDWPARRPPDPPERYVD